MTLSVSEQRERELELLGQKYYFFVKLISPANLITLIWLSEAMLSTSSAYVCPYLALYYLLMIENKLSSSYIFKLMLAQAFVRNVVFISLKNPLIHIVLR